MKKFIVSFCLCAFGLVSYAQSKGEMGVGINLGVAPSLEKGAKVTNFGIGAKFQYNVTNPIRLEADVDYWFKDKGFDVFDVSANVHYLFKIGDKLNIYPLVGIGYARVGWGLSLADDYDNDWSFTPYARDDFDFDEDDFSTSLNRFLFNVGVGVEYHITSKISAGLEIKYQYIKDFNRLPITIGATYHF